MKTPPLEDRLLTEAVNPASATLDSLDAQGIVALMSEQDGLVVAAVRAESEWIARAIELAADRFGRGGRLIYVGAGTSGRLGVLDASECPPTFSTPPDMVVGVIAGGLSALTNSIENAEDRADEGRADLDALGVGPADLVIGIATSGRTPYVLGAIEYSKSQGSATIGISCTPNSLLASRVNLAITPLVGPEILAGSTRLKAGTATKMILNMITTGSMILIGKTHGNRLVDMMPVNQKLRMRARRILRELAGVADDEAEALLVATGGRLKVSLIMALVQLDAPAAVALLDQNKGRVRDAIAAVSRGHNE
jgi:N-acetylmuramic acid 6-phosphate etherase